MAKKKKRGNQERTIQTLLLITAILNLIVAIADLIDKLVG